MTHPYPEHGVAYAVSGIPTYTPALETRPRDPRHWPFIGSVVDYLDGNGPTPATDRRCRATSPCPGCSTRRPICSSTPGRSRRSSARRTIRSGPTSPARASAPCRTTRTARRRTSSIRSAAARRTGAFSFRTPRRPPADVAGRATRTCAGRCSSSSTRPAATSIAESTDSRRSTVIDDRAYSLLTSEHDARRRSTSAASRSACANATA